MNTMSAFSVINITPFSFGAMLVCLTNMVYMLLRGRFEKSQSRLFLAIIVVLFANAACNATSEIFVSQAATSATAETCVRVADYLYFVGHAMLAPMVCEYFLAVCRRTLKPSTLGFVLTVIPFVLTEVLAVFNPLTHWLYYYGADLVRIRNWGMYVLYAVGALYLLYGVVVLFMRWHALTRVKHRAIAYFFIVVCCGIAIQLIDRSVRIELFAESVAILGVMLFVENEDELIDSETGVYNRNALKTNIDAIMDQRDPVYAILVRVTNADDFTRIAGSAQARQYMVSVVADHIKSIVPWYRVYRTAPAQYALFDSTIDDEGALEIARTISERFEHSWNYLDVEIDLHAVVAVARIPDDLKTPSDVFYFVDAPVPPENSKKVLERSDLGYLMRQAAIERAVQSGFEGENYEVYYQPIFDEDGEVRAAEALMRLHDSELGDIASQEFIEVAERIGFIEGIGEHALREVCAFLASGVPQRLGLERICVNLSVIQCMRPDLPEHVRETIQEFNLDPRWVGFEITESVAAGNYEFLNRTMDQIRKNGHHFSMDDYGTGYSNLHSLMSLNFDVVKIDKSLLWDAERSEAGMVIFENSISLLRHIGCRVLVEGVETESQAKLLRQFDVDSYQGFYFAKPMPEEEFAAFLEQYRV